MEHVWKAKGDGEDNARTRVCVSLSKGSIEGSSWSAKALATNQHKLGGYNYGKSS
jgi:hypothetical protein